MLERHIIERLVTDQRRLVVTGASGWLGRATLNLLHSALGEEEFNRRVVCFGSTEKEVTLQKGVRVLQAPLAAIGKLPPQPTWVLHFAFLTKDRADKVDEVEYRAANRRIGETVLNALETIGCEAVFLASSGAAGLANDPTAKLDLRLYGAAKLEDEERFSAWAEAAGKRLVIGRIFALTGPFINKHQAYAIASFILDGLDGRTIAVRAPRRVVRAYVAIRELMSLAFALLGAEHSGVVRFDSGGEPLELGEIATIVARAFPMSAIERAPITEAEPDCYHGDCQAYAGLLATHLVTPVPLPQQVDETIDYLRTGQ